MSYLHFCGCGVVDGIGRSISRNFIIKNLVWHSRSHFLPFPSSFDDCSSEALSLLPRFVNIPVGLTHGSPGPTPLISWVFRYLLPCSLFAFSQKVDSSVCSGAFPWEGRHMFCLLLGRKMGPEDLWVPPPYCSVGCPGICSQTSVWPSFPIWWDMA